MNLPTREECEGWDHMKVALFMCKNNMQDCAGTVTRLKIDGLRLLNLTENDIRKFSLLQQPQLQKMVQDIKKNDGSLLNKIRRLKNKPRPNVPARDYRDFRDSDQCSDPEYNEPCDDPPDDDSYEPPPVHREFTRSPFISLPKGEYLDSSHAGPSRPPKKPIRPVKASKQLPPEPPHPWSDKEEDYVDPDANGEDDYIEPTENPSPKGGNRGDYPILPPALPDRPSSPEYLYEEPEKEEPSTSPQRNRLCPPLFKPGPSLPKPTPRLNKWEPTRPIQQPTDDDEYELCDNSSSHEPPGGPPPRLPKPVQRERSPKPPLLPRQDIKPRQFESTSLPVMHTEQKPSPKAFSLDLKRPKIPLPQFTPPKPVERGCIAGENGSTDQDKDADVYHKPWFANGCDRKTADEALLQSNKDGAFMVRKSSGQDVQQPYTLVVFYKGRVYNIPIRFVPSTKQYALGREKKGEEFFSSVSSIIENHQRNLLVLIDSQSNSKDATKLFFPVRP
ncbi:B-cell linker protein isoform X2 [Xiphophorus couchianus]|uniref:B-cell linker protein isoform X2 n=1 Tax=Xiphophorus couchianus TaxID=32473 RepID=UPI001015DA8D|nr:B-cell linker protein isoform X2 [Xiphophorus couchianus]